MNPGKKKNDFAADSARTWTSMPSTGCLALWNSLFGIEFATFFVEFLIFDNYSNPSSTCYCDYRGCLTQIINGPPEKFFVISSSTAATGPFPSTYRARSSLRLLIPESTQSCGTTRHFNDVLWAIIVPMQHLAQKSALAIPCSRSCGSRVR